MKKLHPTQLKLLELLKRNSLEPLTIREIQEELYISSTSVVHHHLQQLEKKGYLKRNPSNPGDYRIISESDDEIAYLNLYGLAKCGPKGSILDGNPTDKIPLSKKMLGFNPEDAFLVRASGDSMSPKINNGDLVVAKKTNEVSDGLIAVCVNYDEVLIKKIKINDGKIFLLSLNENYQPFEASREYFNVEGVVKKVLSDII
jgi:repressor LexA